MNARGTRTRHLLAALAVAAVALGATACSSSGSDSAKDSPSTSASVAARPDSGTTEADLKKAAEAMATGSLKGSADTYAYLSGTCVKKFTSTEWATNLQQIVDGLRSVIPAMATAKVDTVTTRNVTPTSAEVNVTYVDGDGNAIGAENEQWTAWVVEDGVWVTSECSSAKDFVSGGG